jgi:hypothetical protein
METHILIMKSDALLVMVVTIAGSVDVSVGREDVMGMLEMLEAEGDLSVDMTAEDAVGELEAMWECRPANAEGVSCEIGPQLATSDLQRMAA